MAAVRPLFYDGSGLKQMSASQILAIQNRCVYMYGSDPSATITVVSSGGNISPNMTDTRLQAGTHEESSGDGDANFNETADYDTAGGPTTKTGITYDRISQTNASLSAPTDTNNKLYPMYYDGNNIVAMSATDMFDTFITQAIDTLVDGQPRAGTFKVTTSTSEAGHTLVSSTPVFIDTRANPGAYSLSGIGTQNIDQPTTIASYYMHRCNQGSGDEGTPTYDRPIQISTSNQFETYSTAAFDAILLAEMRHHTVNTSGSLVTYNINGSGNDKGIINNTKLNGSSGQQRQAFNSAGTPISTGGSSGDVYRSQQWPGGTAVNDSTFTLRITRS